MKNLLLVCALFFFAPVPNFAIVSSTMGKTETTTFKKPEPTKQKKRLWTYLSIAIGCVIAGYLVASTPVLAAIAFIIGLVFAILALIIALKE